MNGETLTTIIAIFLAAILIGIFPLMSIADRNDDVSQLAIQTKLSEFVDTVRKTGRITQDSYDKLVLDLYSTGNTYNIAIEVQKIDENPAKKTAQSGAETFLGESIYFSEFTSQIENQIQLEGTYYLKEGDIITVSASNSNTTIAQSLKNFFYSLSGNNTYSIVATQSGVIAANGS